MVKDTMIASLEKSEENFENEDAETFDEEILSKNYEENSFITNCKNNDDLCKAACGLEWKKIDDLVDECNDLINNTTFKEIGRASCRERVNSRERRRAL